MFPVPNIPAATAQVRALPLRQLLFALFFDPAVLLFVPRDGWRRALRLMAGFALLTGLILGLVRIPSLFAAAADWSRWLSREVGAFEVKADGTLGWDLPSDLPHTTRHRGWRIDFVGAGIPFAVPQGGPERRGVWISPRDVQVWYRTPGTGAMPVPVMKDGRIWGVVELTRLLPAETRLPGDEFASFSRNALIFALPVFFVQQMLTVLLPVVFYTLLFAVVPVFIRGARETGGLQHSFTFYGYASIPPLLCAGVYAGLDLPFLRYDTAFVLAFVAYLLLVARAVQRVLAPPE